jgi:hypothetical protein
MTGEDDALDTRYFCEILHKKHKLPVTLNGFCQGGVVAVLDIISGELDGLVDALITCVAPMDGTRSKALIEYLAHLPGRFRDLGYALKDLPNGNSVVDGKVMSWVYKLKSMDREAPIYTLYRDLMMFDDPQGKKAHGEQAPFTKVPNGVPSLELRMPLLFSEGVRTGRIGLERFVDLTAANPARLFGLYPRKGCIQVGSDADLAVWDPEREVAVTQGVLHDRMDYTPFEGMVVRGWPVVTISRGEVIWMEGDVRGEPGRGRFVHRPRSSLTSLER